MAYEPFSRGILGLWLSWARNSLQAEKFLETLVRLHDRHPVWTDGAPYTAVHAKALGMSITGIGLVNGSIYNGREGCMAFEG
jgi:transposase-like protein